MVPTLTQVLSVFLEKKLKIHRFVSQQKLTLQTFENTKFLIAQEDPLDNH